MTIMQKKSSLLSFLRTEPFVPVIWFLVSLCIALLAGSYLFRGAITSSLTSAIIATSIDASRSLLIASLLLTVATGFIAGALSKRKSGATLGAVLLFVWRYLLDFIHIQQQPLYDIGGDLRPLDLGALVNTSLVLLSLSILSAFIGSSVGVATFDVVLDRPLKFISKRWRKSLYRSSETASLAQVVRASSLQQGLTHLWDVAHVLGGILLIGVVIFASQSTNIFLYVPEYGLHGPAQLPPIAAGVPSNGTLLSAQALTCPSLGSTTRLFDIYLPPTYNTPLGKNKHYPTVYLLHGSPGQYYDWATIGDAPASVDELISKRLIPEMILVMPDGNGRLGATSEWGNSGDHKQNLENAIAFDLVKYIDKHFRTIANAQFRAIGGLSMGGFGAANIAIHHADIFGTAISFGGYFNGEGSIWGTDRAYLAYNSPSIEIRRDTHALKLRFVLGDGARDGAYYKGMLQFAKLLNSLHVEHVTYVNPGGHQWKVWDSQLYLALQWLKWFPKHVVPQVHPTQVVPKPVTPTPTMLSS